MHFHSTRHLHAEGLRRGLCYPDRLARIFPFQPYRYSAKAGPRRESGHAALRQDLAQHAGALSLAEPLQSGSHHSGRANLRRTPTATTFTLARPDSSRIGSAAAFWNMRASPAFTPIFRNLRCPIAARLWSARASSAWARWKIIRPEWSIAMNRRSPVRRRIAWSCCATRTRTSARSSCCIPIPSWRSTGFWMRRPRARQSQR